VAGGVVLASLAGGFNVDLFSYLFGNILAISNTELVLAALLFVLVIAAVWYFYYDLFAISFDEDLATASGIRVERVNALLALLTALTVVLAMKLVGIMLISALLILPAVTALQIAKGFLATLLTAAGCGAFSVIAGILLSFLLNLPTGGVIVLVNVALFCMTFFGKKMKSQIQG
jgi:zinc transport system permease protein